MRKYLVLTALSMFFFVHTRWPLYGAAGPLELTLRTDAKSYVLGAPVFVEMRLRNVSPSPLMLRGGLHITYCALQIRREGGEFEEVEFLDVKPAVEAPTPFILEPGKEIVGSFPFLLRAGWRAQRERRLIFESLGNYTLRMRYAQPATSGTNEPSLIRMISTEVKIAIELPGEGFEEYSACLKKHASDGIELDQGGPEALEQFIKKYPDSIYAQYAKAITIMDLCRDLKMEELWAKLSEDRELVKWAEEVLMEFGDARGRLSQDALYLLAFYHLMEGTLGPAGDRSEHLQESERFVERLRQTPLGSWWLHRIEEVKEDIEPEDLDH